LSRKLRQDRGNGFRRDQQLVGEPEHMGTAVLS
jgi:hypothetical protein